MEALKPGVYVQPMSEYLRIPALSNSVLGLLKRHVPARAKYLADNPTPSTDAQIESSALHTAVFEPDLLEEEYTVADQCVAMTAKGSRCSNMGSQQVEEGWVCGVHAKGREIIEGKAVLSRSQWMMVTGARDALLGNRLVRWYLDQLSRVESTMIGSRNGYLLKGRQDGVADDLELVLDLKSVNGLKVTASQDDFMWEMFRRGYHRQQGMYRLIERQLGMELPHRVIIVVEKVPPYLCGVYRIMDAVVEAGAGEAIRLMDQWIEYSESGKWPGYPAGEQEQDLGLPDRAWDTIEITEWEDL